MEAWLVEPYMGAALHELVDVVEHAVGREGDVALRRHHHLHLHHHLPPLPLPPPSSPSSAITSSSSTFSHLLHHFPPTTSSPPPPSPTSSLTSPLPDHPSHTSITSHLSSHHRAKPVPALPHIVMPLDVNLVENPLRGLQEVLLHLHGNIPRQEAHEQPLLDRRDRLV